MRRFLTNFFRFHFTLVHIMLFLISLLTLPFLERHTVNTYHTSLQDEAQWMASWVARMVEISPSRTLAGGIAFLHPNATRSPYPNYAPPEWFIENPSGVILYDYRGQHPGVGIQSVVGPEGRGAGPQGNGVLFASAPILSTANQVIGRVGLIGQTKPLYPGILRQWGWLTLMIFLVGWILSFGTIVFIRRLTRPLENLTRAVQSADAAQSPIAVNLEPTLEPSLEIHTLGQAMERMNRRIRGQIQALTHEKRTLESIIEQMGAGVMVVDRYGRILVVNTQMARLLARQKPELVDGWYWEAIANPTMVQAVQLVLHSGENQRREFSVGPAGDVAVELNVTPIRGDDDPLPTGAVLVLHDVSRWRHLERMRADFLANVSHELRTPITAVRGFAETLLDGALEDEEMSRQFIQIIYDEADRISRLVQDLLDLTKIESGHAGFQFLSCDVGELVRQAVTRFTHEVETRHGVSLCVDVPEHAVTAEVAPDRIAQVLINLISNAMHFTPTGGVIEVKVVDEPTDVRVAVHDSGIGIPEQELTKIFERFYRTDKSRNRQSGGTGLGLSIVKHIIEVHNGVVYAESEVGKGSTFTFVLPKSQEQT